MGNQASLVVVIATLVFLPLGFHGEVIIRPCGGLFHVCSMNEPKLDAISNEL